MKTVALLIIFISLSPLYSEVAHKVSFYNLTEQHSESLVEVRGFLYTTPDGRTLLAPQPNLRSCCVGSQEREHEQIALIDMKNVPTTKQAIDIRGTFHLDQNSKLMSISEPKLVEHNRGSYHLAIMAVVGTLLLTFIVLRRRA